MSTDENGATGAGGAVDNEHAGGRFAARVAGHRFNVAALDDVRPHALRAWASACWHLRLCGTSPLPPEHVRRALARRGWW